MMKIEDITIKWDAIRSSQGYMQRLDPDHPLDFFIGIDEKGLKEIVLITGIEPSQLKSSKSIQVEKGKRTDGLWAIQIKLINENHEDVFTRLCWDLIESTEKCTDKKQGLEMVISRFVRWQKLLESGVEGMSLEVIKGLIGELKFAEKVLLKKLSLDEVINSWLGPDGADRDFVFGSTWIEVKTVSVGKPTITISSLNQLESDVVGTLAIATIDATSESDRNGFSFYSVIENFKSLLSTSPEALSQFEEKLIAVGYYDRKEYKDKYFTLSEFKFFKVDDNFPKLTSKNTRKEIASARYDLTISEIQTWKITEAQIWT